MTPCRVRSLVWKRGRWNRTDRGQSENCSQAIGFCFLVFFPVMNARSDKPFKPFMVELASGSWLTIEHPEALIHRGRSAVYIDPEGNITLFDNEGVTQLTDIAGNGSKRPREP